MIASVFSGTHNFFHSATWDWVRGVGAGLVLLFWVATIFWVIKDARRRVERRTVIALCALIAIAVPFIGPLIYMLFRPPEYLEDVRERRLEIRAIEQRLGLRACPVCDAETEPEFLVCPVCTTRLRNACSTCRRPLEAAWQICPYCESPVTNSGGDTVVGTLPEP